MRKVASRQLSKHTGRVSRRQQVGGYLSRSTDSERFWPRREGQHVHASVSSASYYFRSRPARWSCAGRTGSSDHKSRPRNNSKNLLPTPGAHSATTSAPEFASRSAGPRWAHVGWSPWYRCASKIDGPVEPQRLGTRTTGVTPGRVFA